MNNEHLSAELAPRQFEREERLISAVSETIARRRDALRITVPVELERSIRMALAEEQSVTDTTPWYQSVLDALRKPAYSLGVAGAAVAVIVALLTNNPKAELPSEITTAALMAFHGVHSGATSLDVSSNDKAKVSAYLASQGVNHDIFYPEVEAELMGANVFSVNGLPCAELVYKVAGHTIALLQVDDTSIQSKQVEMDSVVAEDVALSRWHWASTQDNGTLFVWKSNSIMCTVVSDLQIDEVSSLFRLEAL